MPIFLLAALGVPALYVGLIRGLALACAPTRETDSQAATWLRWLHWLVTGSALLCLVLVTGELELHYPLFVLAWLLGSGVLAGPACGCASSCQKKAPGASFRPGGWAC